METRKIPFFNYPALFRLDENELLSVMADVCRRGAYILQQDLKDFERDFAAFNGVKHAIGVADCTNGLVLGLRAMGIGPGDEVIVPSHTFVASASAIHLAGAAPVLADMGQDHLVDPKSIENVITSKTKAIMPVHLNGRTCNMDPIVAIAKKHNLQIIEDAAQALGSTFKGKAAGTFGACGAFSFYPAKSLGCFGDGGAVITNDDALAESIYRLRDHGKNKEGVVVCWGFNSRLDNLQAAILNYKLKKFRAALARRREIAALYQNSLCSLKDLVLPPGPEGDDHYDVYQNYELESGYRDELRSFLESRGVGTIIQWGGRAVHQFDGLGFPKVSLPATELFFTRCMMLPMHIALSDEDVNYVTSSIHEFYGKKNS